jgi:hypothetical protein
MGNEAPQKRGATKRTRIGRVELIEPGHNVSRFSVWLGMRRELAEAADTPGCAAGPAAAAATTATPAATTAATTAAATTAAATTAAMPTATATRNLHEVARAFLVEKVERRQADVGDFFFAERERLRRRNVQFLRSVNGWYSRC